MNILELESRLAHEGEGRLLRVHRHHLHRSVFESRRDDFLEVLPVVYLVCQESRDREARIYFHKLHRETLFRKKAFFLRDENWEVRVRRSGKYSYLHDRRLLALGRYDTQGVFECIR